MLDITRTTTVLLEGLHDPSNDVVWTEFDRRYRPVVFGFARRLGLSDADASDVAQETLTRFLEEYRRGVYDRERGRLRSWLVTLTRYRVAELRRARATKRERSGDLGGVDLADENALTRIWEEERRRQMLRDAMEAFRQLTHTSERTIKAFDMLVVREMPVKAVADELGMTAQEVYLAKSRVAERLRSHIASIEAVYDQ